jgi:predicted regulator of Ras-like GTPase activity (Roadblock/LC7/MglB family)
VGGVFSQVLRGVQARAPEAQLLLIIGMDGIPVERLAAVGDPSLEAAAAEYTTLLRASLAAGADTDLGELHELAIATERMTALLVAITPEYFLFAALKAGALEGRARHALRMAASRLRTEFA